MGNDTPKIAILMSCYNHEQFVSDAMDSIIAQTYENWELYVVNDGSTDRSGEILASYKDHRIHYYDFKENTKFAGALGFLQDVLRNADVDYIAVMSTDDIWIKDKLQKQIEIFNKYPEYQACFTWDKVIFNTSEKGYYDDKTLYSHERNRCRYEWLNYFFWKGNCFNECSFMIHKQVFYELGALNQHLRQLSDFHMWYKVAVKYPLYLIEEELTYYRRHGNNLSELNQQVLMRNINEHYQILKEIIITMDKDLFHRSFYMNLPYTKCETEEELNAEKFILFVSTNDFIKQQVAMDIYFTHCKNQDFISILEKKYFFREQDLLDLTGKCGLQTVFLSSQRNVMFFSPISVLSNIINKQQLTEDKLELYRYSTLFDLWNLTDNFEGGKEQFDNIKQFIMNKQDLKKMKKNASTILFLIAQTSQWDYSKMIKKKQEENIKCYVAFVPSIDDAMHGVICKNLQNKSIEGAEILNLYNEKEHSLRFLHELHIEADCIYYIDCIDSKYECPIMASGYSLATEYYGILKKDIYQSMVQNHENRILEMMKDILFY